MTQDTIGQRIKFLIEAQKMSVRKFAQLLDLSEATVRNYFDRGTKPSSDFFEKIDKHFPSFNLTWLITGKGEPLLPSSSENILSPPNAQKFFQSQVVGTNNGPNNQQQHNASANQDQELKNQLVLAEKEIQRLSMQVEMQNALLAAKEETITLLRGSYRNPN